MSDFWLFFKLGLEHVFDWKAYDHVLFLIVLCAAYTFSSWRRLLVLITIFTIGHSVSLLLANYNVVTISSKWIEFLIPITILVTAMFNLFTVERSKRDEKKGLLYIVTVFFGLIHGFGFASFFKALNNEGAFLPLLEFALGIETAQIIIVFMVLVLGYLAQTLFRFNNRDWVLVISSIVIGLVIPILVENWIF